MIVQRRDEVIDRWMERFQERLGPGIPPPTDVVDSVPRFLDEIVRQLTEPLQELEASARRVSGPHGRHRFFGGTDLRTVVLEFETILEVLVDMVIDYAPRVELAAWMRLHRWLFTGLKEAVATYTAARNQQLEEQTSGCRRESRYIPNGSTLARRSGTPRPISSPTPRARTSTS